MNPPSITPEQANTFINVTLPLYLAIATAIAGALFTLYSRVKELTKRVDTHSDRIHDLALNSTPAQKTTVEVQPVVSQSPGAGALGTIAILALLLMPGCASDPNAQQDIKLGVAILNAAIDTYTQIDSSKASGKPLSKGQIAQLAKNDVNGVLAQMQGNVGKTPDSANAGDGVAIGAANPKVGQAIQDALPSAPISQPAINSISAVVAK